MAYVELHATRYDAVPKMRCRCLNSLVEDSLLLSHSKETVCSKTQPLPWTSSTAARPPTASQQTIKEPRQLRYCPWRYFPCAIYRTSSSTTPRLQRFFVGKKQTHNKVHCRLNMFYFQPRWKDPAAERRLEQCCIPLNEIVGCRTWTLHRSSFDFQTPTWVEAMR